MNKTIIQVSNSHIMSIGIDGDKVVVMNKNGQRVTIDMNPSKTSISVSRGYKFKKVSETIVTVDF